MTPEFVIDNSVVMTWCFQDEANRYADSVLNSLEHTSAIVPMIWTLEIGNVLAVAERKNRLTQADSNEFLQLLSELPITVEHYNPKKLRYVLN